MSVTRSNKTKKATAADTVMTPIPIAKAIIDHFSPHGKILEPASGTGNILSFLPAGSEWCEITKGKDFFEWNEKVDWIITNPPYSIYDLFLQHSFEIADNVVFLVPIQKAFKSMKTERMIETYGGLKEILLIGSGTKCGFAFGFPVGCLFYQRNYKGTIKKNTLKI